MQEVMGGGGGRGGGGNLKPWRKLTLPVSVFLYLIIRKPVSWEGLSLTDVSPSRRAECSSKCSSRCSGTQYKKACLTYCNKCCAVCLCVPPGLYGNKAACPCYNNWKTKEGGPKCP
jgi:hypothetical protein